MWLCVPLPATASNALCRAGYGSSPTPSKSGGASARNVSSAACERARGAVLHHTSAQTGRRRIGSGNRSAGGMVSSAKKA